MVLIRQMYQIIKVSLTFKCIHHQNDHIYIIYTIMLWLQCHNLCNQFFSFNCLSQCTIYIKWMTGVRNTYTINCIPEHSTSKQEMVLEWSFFFMNIFVMFCSIIWCFFISSNFKCLLNSMHCSVQFMYSFRSDLVFGI